MTCLDSMLCLLTSVLKTRFYWAFPFLSNFTSCYWENRRIGYDNQIVMKFVMIYSSTFFYLFFVFFSSSSSSLYFDKFKVFVHFEFVFSQRCLTLLYLGPYWLRKKYSDIILTKIQQNLTPIIELQNVALLNDRSDHVRNCKFLMAKLLCFFLWRFYNLICNLEHCIHLVVNTY